MKLSTIFSLLFASTIFVFVACNGHLDDKDVTTDEGLGLQVETLSSSKTALWVEMGDTYDFALTRSRNPGDPDLIGHKINLPQGLSAMIVTGEDRLMVEAGEGGTFEIREVPAEKVGEFEMLVRNIWMLPAGWQPNLFPRTEGEARDLEILLSAFVCAQNLNLYSNGCLGRIPSSLFHRVGESSYYEWGNRGHVKYVFLVKNRE